MKLWEIEAEKTVVAIFYVEADTYEEAMTRAQDYAYAEIAWEAGHGGGETFWDAVAELDPSTDQLTVGCVVHFKEGRAVMTDNYGHLPS